MPHREEFEAWMKSRGTPLAIEHPQAFDAWVAARTMTHKLNAARPPATELRSAPKWWHCDTHGPATADAWGCPECVRAMRDEIKRLRDVLDAWSQDGRLQSYNDRERFREAARYGLKPNAKSASSDAEQSVD